MATEVLAAEQHGTTNTTDSQDSCAGRDMTEEEEERAVGVVSWGLYWDYLRSGSPTVAVVGLLIYLLVAHGMLLIPNVWLETMSKMSYSDQKSRFTLGVYGGLAGLSVFVEAIGIFGLYVVLLKSSEKLHDKLTHAVITSPVLFFDTNPVGRIMNRFSKDIGAMDDLIPMQIIETLIAIMFCLAVMVLIGIVNYWLFLVVVPAIGIFITICRLYLNISRELSRIEAIRCSPVYAHFSETMTGLEVIHSLEMKERSIEKYYNFQNMHTKAFSLVIFTSRSVGMYLDLLSAVFITALGFGTLFLSMDAAFTGLLLTYAVSLLRLAASTVRIGSDVDNMMVSVERVKRYTQLPSEPGYNREAQHPKDWPHAGDVSLRGISMVYLEGGPCVLEDISFDVKSKEKVGIAGRTGAGKSSLVAALFRMPDPQGQVLIDGVDLGTINIQAARRSMAVITQDPVLFAGTLKKNLDPFNLFSKKDIWTVLEEVQLKDRVNRLEGLLEYSVGEGGSGFSAGEKQLFCLARALLQRCKILVLDEATANVDYKTDQLIQQVIRQKFTNCTVLTIAHRLNTIMDYDKVLVLDQGHVVEYDSPSVLAGKSNGVFASLLQSHESSSMKKA